MRKEKNINRKPAEERAAQDEAGARVDAARSKKVVKNVRRLKWRQQLRKDAFPLPEWLKDEPS